MKKILNYLGQFRIYSLLDLIVLLVASGASAKDFFGVILLHLGFISYLETRHAHPYREQMPKYLWVIITTLGIVFYRHLEVIAFLVASYFYARKTEKYFGWSAPFLRALQYFFLVGGIIGYHHPLTFISLVLIFVRNFAGDLRDIVKDRNENLRTLPILLGLKKDIKYIHLLAMLTTTFVWFNYANFSWLTLSAVFLIEIFSYRLTPR